MPSRPTKQSDFGHTWYLKEWATIHGKRQVDMIEALDIAKGTASTIWNGQRYTQKLIDEVAAWLNVQPYELLLPPEEAIAIRRMRAAAADIMRTVEQPADQRRAIGGSGSPNI